MVFGNPRKTDLSQTEPPLLADFFLSKRTFQDIDELEQGLRFLGSRPTQLSRGQLQAGLNLVSSSNLQVMFTSSKQALRLRGLKPTGLLRFYLTTAPTPRSPLSHGVFICPDTIFGFDSTRDTSVVLPENHQGIVISLQQSLLEHYANQMGRFDLDQRFLQRNFVRARPAAIAQLKAYLQQTNHLLSKDAQFLLQGETQTSFKQNLMPLLIDCLEPANAETQFLSAAQRTKLLNQVEEYLMAHCQHPVTLETLCRALNCKERMVFYQFQEAFGMGPMAYLKVLRLNQVHKALKAANPRFHTVINIATKYGFWSMNHFSRDYKQMFGQSPSITLKGISDTQKVWKSGQ